MSRIAEVTPGYDLSPLPGGAAAPGAQGTKNKRKQTLLSLLDALQELSKDGDLDVGSTWPQFIQRTIPSHARRLLIKATVSSRASKMIEMSVSCDLSPLMSGLGTRALTHVTYSYR